MPCLLLATRETVYDASQVADAFDRDDDRFDSPARVHDDGQVELARQLQLCVEIAVLGLGIEAFDVKIQTALADRNRTLACNP